MSIQNKAVVYGGCILGVIVGVHGSNFRVHVLHEQHQDFLKIERRGNDKAWISAQLYFIRPATLEDFTSFGVEYREEFQVGWSLRELPEDKTDPFMVERDIYYFFQLSVEAQQQALKNQVGIQRFYVERDLAEAKAKIQGNIHQCINNKYFISRLAPSRDMLRKMTSSHRYLLNIINGNACWFYADGAALSFDGKNKFTRFDNGQYIY